MAYNKPADKSESSARRKGGMRRRKKFAYSVAKTMLLITKM